MLSTNSYSQTYYYKQTKTVKANGSVVDGGKGGQFITFKQSICFESNKKGIGVGHGVLEFNRNYSDKFKTYVGNSYWGKETVFRFSQDLTRLNVCLEDGTVYVYVKMTAPSNQTTCSLIRKSTPSTGRNTTPIVSPIITNPAVSSSTPSRGSSSSSSTQSKPSKRWKNVTRTIGCTYCQSSGRCSTCNGKGWFYGNGYDQLDCPNCDGFKTGKCRHCHGIGSIQKTEQVYE